MKKILFSLVLIGALSLGININPWQTINSGISNNIVVAAEENMDMSNHESTNESHDNMKSNNDEEDSHDSETSPENRSSHDNGTSHEEKSQATDTGHNEKSTHEAENEKTAGGHGHGGNSEYTPPNKIFLMSVLNIMVISIVMATIIKQRRGRAENESGN